MVRVGTIVRARILAFALVLSVITVFSASPTAHAATQSCTFHFSNHSQGTIVTKVSGQGYGACASVQARTYYYYGAGQYGWVTGSIQSTLNQYSSALNSSASVENRNGRAKPINTWSAWGNHGANGYKSVSVNT